MVFLDTIELPLMVILDTIELPLMVVIINGYIRYHTPDHLWYLGYHGKIIHKNLALHGWNHE